MRKQEAREEPEARDDAQAAHHLVLPEVLLAARQRRVDQVAEVGLRADVREAEKREDLAGK